MLFTLSLKYIAIIKFLTFIKFTSLFLIFIWWLLIFNKWPSSPIIINVIDWGAVGDGIVDDTKVIQECIDYAQERDLIVVFPPGVYLNKASITFKSNSSFTISPFNEGEIIK